MSSKQGSRLRTVRSYVQNKREKYNIYDSSYAYHLQSDQQFMLGGFLGIFCSFLFFTSLIQIIGNSVNPIWFVGILLSLGGLKLTRDAFKISIGDRDDRSE